MSTEPDPNFIDLDLDDLTIEEIEEIEERTGCALDDVAKPGAKKGTMLRALAFVVRRRSDPGFTWEAAGALKIKLSAEPDPTDAVNAG